MKYEKMRNYGEGKFRRITGLRRRTFNKIVCILMSAETARRSKGGPKPSLKVEDMLLATLEYWREYRTYAHISVEYELSESQIFRIVKWVENIVIRDGTFSLPGKKALLERKTDYEAILLDATESPVERPKKQDLSEYTNITKIHSCQRKAVKSRVFCKNCVKSELDI